MEKQKSTRVRTKFYYHYFRGKLVGGSHAPDAATSIEYFLQWHATDDKNYSAELIVAVPMKSKESVHEKAMAESWDKWQEELKVNPLKVKDYKIIKLTCKGRPDLDFEIEV